VGPEEIHKSCARSGRRWKSLARAIAGDEEATLITQIRLLRSDSRDEANRARRCLSSSASCSRRWRKRRSQTQRFDGFAVELWKKLDDFAEMLSKSATEQVINALKEVIADFNRNLTEQFGENFKELNAAVEKLVQWQENYRVQLEQMGEQYAQGSGDYCYRNLRCAYQRGIQADSGGDGRTQNGAETTQHQLAELERHLEAFRDMRDRAVEAVPQIQEQMNAMVKDVSAATKDAGEQIMTASQAVNSAIVEGAKEFKSACTVPTRG
jgi:uncharacterized protein YukE